MTQPRFHVDLPLATGAELTLPADAARHAQVLRLQPGLPVTLFDGQGGQWRASITRMGRGRVDVAVGTHDPVEREACWRLHLAVGLFALDRMDWLVEKATELGAASLTPVRSARSNVALSRVEKRLPRWRAISARACEQCGRNRLLHVHEPTNWSDFLHADAPPTRWVLTPGASLPRLGQHLARGRHNDPDIVLLSGPEGGLTDAEQEAAAARGFLPLGLGARILRAETAPLAVLGALLCSDAPRQPSP